LLVGADDVNLLRGNINTIRANREALTDANNMAAVAENAEKTKYMLMSLHKNAGQNHNANLLFSDLLSKNVSHNIQGCSFVWA
jgi:lipoprotein NlpI